MTTPHTLQSVTDTQEKGYSDLKNYFANINTMFSVRNILAVDMMTAMPPGGVPQRLNDIASITKRIYAETTAPSVTNLLDRVEQNLDAEENLTEWDQVNVREMRRIHSHLAALPPHLYVAAVRVANEGRRQHKAALLTGDWQTAGTYLQQVVDLYRQIAALKQKAFNAATPYEALLKGYADDLTEAQVNDLYNKLSAPFTALRAKILETQGEGGSLTPLPEDMDRGEQVAVSQALLEAMGINFANGSLMVAASSPYAGGTRSDVRILVRTNTPHDVYAFLKDSLYQGARALYIQNLPTDWHQQPVGQNLGALMMNAVSLLYETVIGRSAVFLDHVAAGTRKLDRDHLDHTRRRVRTAATRDRADEVSKISHDLIRYRIEKELISGAIEVKDLPDRWAAASEEFLGLVPRDLTEGPLQNPDWFTGRFGFIPTNTLSHMIAVALYDKIEEAHPDLKERIKAGDLTTVQDFLTRHVFSKGRLVNTMALMEDITGTPLDHERLLQHFENRYLAGTR